MFKVPELSRWLGRPVHLFLFTHGPLVWRFTSSDTPVVVGEHTYTPAPGIERGPVRESAERRKNEVKISFPYLLDPAASPRPPTQSLGDLWRPYPPSGAVHVACLSLQRDDADRQAVVDWMGWVAQPQFTDTKLELTCTREYARHRARSSWLRAQRSCPLLVYSQGEGMCNLDPDAHVLAATLTAVDGVTLQADAFGTAPLPMAGGFLRWLRADGRAEQRTIMGHTGTTVTLDYPGPELAAGLDVEALPGCDQSPAACAARGNSVNYGGCPHLPNKNPWNGHPP